MPLYQKVEGIWTECKMPYVKRNGVWTQVQQAYVKRSGVWVKAHESDKTPPVPPEITLQVVEDRNGNHLVSRWLRVGVRLPGASNDPEAKLIRVLGGYQNKPPVNQDSETYIRFPYPGIPEEPWSEWRYNSFGPHADTSEYVYKRWPYNAKAGSIITGDKTYYFGGWSADQYDNWSIATQAEIKVPKAAVDANNIVLKETTVQPISSGSWRAEGFQSGNLIQQGNPKSQGLWFYGSQFVDSIGAQTTGSEHIKVTEAQIYLVREGTDADSGAANANVYLFWTPYGTVANLPAVGAPVVRNEITNLGTLAKGQAKWFTLPAAYYNNLNKSIKGFGLDCQSPIRATPAPDDYSNIVSHTNNLECGQVHIRWQETL